MYGNPGLVLFRKLLLWGFVGVGCLYGVVASASTPGYYTGTDQGNPVKTSTLVEAAQIALASCLSHSNFYYCHLSTTSEPANPRDGIQYSAVAGYSSAAGNPRGYTILMTYHGCTGGTSYTPDRGECWMPPDCSQSSPQIFEERTAYHQGGTLVIGIGTAADDQGQARRVGSEGCGFQRDVHADPVGCYEYAEGIKSGETWCAYQYAPTGDYLGTGGGGAGAPPSNDPAIPQSYPPCETGAGGTVVCTNPSKGDQCGMVNGHSICVPAIPNTGCESLGSTSSSICGPQASPPTDPATQQPAVPVDHVGFSESDSDGTETVTNTTVYNAGGTGSSPSSGGTGGTGQGGSTGSGAGAGSGTCNPSVDPSGCGEGGDSDSGEGTFQGDSLDDVPSFGDSLNTFLTAINSGGIVGAVSGITFADQAGECPKPVFTVFGKQYTMDAQCTIMANVGSSLDMVVYAMWGLLGLFILLSA